MARTEPGVGLFGQAVTQNTGPILWPPSLPQGLTTDVPLCRSYWPSNTLLATSFSSMMSIGYLKVVEKASLLEDMLRAVVCLPPLASISHKSNQQHTSLIEFDSNGESTFYSGNSNDICLLGT